MADPMTPVEKLQAAIDKLTELRKASDDDPRHAHWTLGDRSTAWGVNVVARYEPDGTDVVAERVYPADAELIVTLHRTLDAQLAILRGARSDINAYGGKPASWPAANYLADAILGAGS